MSTPGPRGEGAAGEWPQYLIEFPDRETAEATGTGFLAPALTKSGLAGWWFVRKTPAWRLRLPLARLASAMAPLEAVLDDLVSAGRATLWSRGIYEPEIHAFGGPLGLVHMHRLAHDDSRHALAYLGHSTPLSTLRTALGRRELGVLLITALQQGAGLDWYEQGDVWAKVLDHRTSPGVSPAEDNKRLQATLQRLLTVDAGPGSTLVTTGALAPVKHWLAAFHATGSNLAGLAATGQLTRGLRAVLAHHVLFAWNRLGLTADEQHRLAQLAKHTIFCPTTTPRHPVPPGDTTTTLTR